MGLSEQREFDRDAAEAAICGAIHSKLECLPSLLESETPGVVAISRLDSHDQARIDWQEVASEVSREIGIGVLCVANCDWQIEDDSDEEATLIAFDVPELPEEYRNDHRNEITPVDPQTAPSTHDFKRLREAKEIVAARLSELTSRETMFRLANIPSGDVADEISEIKEAVKVLDLPGSYAMLDAIEILDFTSFIELALRPAASGQTLGM
jgi:hypothetical protein